jgi:hypothetical protein
MYSRDAGGKEVIQSVHVGGHARDEAADGAVIVEADRQALEVLKDFLAQVIHGVLADLLHDANLEVHKGKAQGQGGHVCQRNPAESANGRRLRNLMVHRRNDVAVHGYLEEPGTHRRQRGHRQGQQSGNGDPAPVRMQIAEEPPRQVGVVNFA